jgi:hypothetical protein
MDEFNEMMDQNNKILYTLLFAIPINVFLPLCLAFRFTRRRLHILVAVVHFVLALANGGILGAIFAIYPPPDVCLSVNLIHHLFSAEESYTYVCVVAVRGSNF